MRILSPDFKVIAVEVNQQGLLTSGLLLKIAKKYPQSAKYTREFALTHELGDVYAYHGSDKIILFCFSQNNGRTNYRDLKSCVDKIKRLGYEEVAIIYKDKKTLEIWNKIENLYVMRSGKHEIVG